MPILQYMTKLPRTSAHPAGSYISTQWNQARETYLSLRREFILNKCITPAVTDFDNVMQTSSPGGDEEGRKEKCRIIAVIVQGMLSLMQVRTSQGVLLAPNLSDISTSLNRCCWITCFPSHLQKVWRLSSAPRSTFSKMS